MRANAILQHLGDRNEHVSFTIYLMGMVGVIMTTILLTMDKVGLAEQAHRISKKVCWLVGRHGKMFILAVASMII